MAHLRFHRLIPIAIAASLAWGTPAAAQLRSPQLEPVVDLVVPAGPVTLALTRQVATEATPGPLGSRWSLYLTGFGNPVPLDGAPSASNAEQSPFVKDVLDPSGRLVSRTDRRSNTLSMTYGEGGRVSRIVGPKGVTLEFTADADGHFITIAAPPGEVAYAYTGDNLVEVRVNGGPPLRYEYGAGLGPTRIHDPSSGVVDVTYDRSGRITGYRWPDGAAQRIEYDDRAGTERRIDETGGTTVIKRHSVTEVTDAAGHKWTMAYDPVKRVRTETDPAGATTRTIMDERGRIAAAIDPLGGTTKYEYDTTTGLLNAIVGPDGARRTFEYDHAGSLVAERAGPHTIRAFTYFPDGAPSTLREYGQPERRFGYDEAGRVNAVADALGGTTAFDYDARGNLVKETNPLGGVTLRTYDAHNRLLATTDPAGAVTFHRYDERSRLVERVDPLGAATATVYAYDDRGRVAAVTDAAGTTRYEFDPAGRLVTVTRPGNIVETFAYDRAGNLTRATDAAGRATEFGYDALGRLIKERRPQGLEIQYAYDTGGNLVSVSDSVGTLRQFEVNPVGLVARQTVAPSGSSSFLYDPAGSLTAAVDPLGRRLELTFTPDGLRAVTRDAGGNEIRFSHDAAGRPIAITRSGGGATRITYDPAGNPLAVMEPAGTQRKYVYDPLGRVVAAIDEAGGATRFTYDKAGRVVERRLPDKTRLTYRYDAAGRLVEASDGRFPVKLAYDAAGRVVSTEYSDIRKTVRSEYDAQGRRTRLVMPDGAAIRYTYNATGDIDGIVLPDGSTIALAHDPAGRVRTIEYPNGVRGQWIFDAAGRTASLTYATRAGESIASVTYTYNGVGQPIERRDERGISRYAYDSAGQLTEEAAPSSTTRYRYAPGGNRTVLEQAGKTTTYQYDANDRLVRIDTPGASEVLSYDERGTPTRRGTGNIATSFTFDGLRRLTKVRSRSGETTFAYSALGDRISRRDEDGRTYFIYDGLDLVQEIDGSGRVHATYVHAPGIDRPLAMLTAGGAHFFHADRNGSILLITDAAGAAVSSYDYDAFGNVRSKKETVTSPFGYTGRELDRSTGLYYYRARYYDATLGRFLSPDPAGPHAELPLTWNAYIYTLNNPVALVDPLGLEPTPGPMPFFLNPEEELEYWRTIKSRPGNPFHDMADDAIERLHPRVIERARQGQTPPDWRAQVRSQEGVAPGAHRADGQTHAPGGRAPRGGTTVNPSGSLPPRAADTVVPGRAGSPPRVDPNVTQPGRGRPPLGSRSPYGTGGPNAPGGPSVLPGGIVIVILTAAQFAICVAENLSFQQCVERFLITTAIGIPVAMAVNAATQYLIKSAAGVLLGKVVVAAAVAYVAYQVYDAEQAAARALLEAEAATIAELAQIDQRIVGTSTSSLRAIVGRAAGADAVVRERLGKIHQANEDRADALNEIARRFGTTTTDGGVSGANDCTDAAALQTRLQTELPRLEREAQQRRTQINTLIDEALAIARLCRTKLDVDNILYRHDYARRLRVEIDTLHQQARQLVGEMDALTAKIAYQGTALQRTDEELRELEVPSAQAQPTLVAADGTPADIEKARQLRLEFRDERVRIIEAIDAARTNYEKRSWPEWFADLFPRSRLDVAAAFEGLGQSLARVDALFNELPSIDELRALHDADTAQARANEARANDLKSRLSGLACSFQAVSLPDALTALKDISKDADAILNVGRNLPAMASACTTTPRPVPPPYPPPDTYPPTDTTPAPGTKPGGGTATPDPPKVLTASIDCGPVLELRPGQNSKTCNIVVKGWLSTTTTPVEVVVGPLLPGFRASPGDTAISGDSMYAGGVSDRAGEYVFTEGFSAAAGAPPGTTQELLILVRQRGHGIVQLPLLTLNVVAAGAPDGSTISPPKPDVAGSGGGFCVWQYKLFGDPPACWNFASASCSNSRYADREEYIRVGNKMTWAEADGRIAELSRYFADAYGCRPPADTKPQEPPPPPPVVQQGSGGNYCVWRYKMFGDAPQCFNFVMAQCGKYAAPYELVGADMTGGEADARVTELSRFFDDAYACNATKTKTPPAPAPPPNTPNPNPPDSPTAPPTVTPPSTPPARTLSRFGIQPHNLRVKVGDAVVFKAYGTWSDAPNAVVELTDVRWGGDVPAAFTAGPAQAGQSFRITATGPDGATDEATVAVELVDPVLTDPLDVAITPPIGAPPGPPAQRPCTAEEQAMWAKIAGAWAASYGPVTFTGSCESVSGFWQQGDVPDPGAKLTQRGVIKNGRATTTGVTFEYAQDWNKKYGTDSCTLRSNVLDCGHMWDMKRK